MGLEQLWRCDVCGVTVAQGEATGWRKVSIAALEEAPPTPPVEGMPYVAPEAPPPPACICTKAACLTAWAKDQNTKAKA